MSAKVVQVVSHGACVLVLTSSETGTGLDRSILALEVHLQLSDRMAFEHQVVGPGITTGNPANRSRIDD